jgi:hypothetical protein
VYELKGLALASEVALERFDHPVVRPATPAAIANQAEQASLLANQLHEDGAERRYI